MQAYIGKQRNVQRPPIVWVPVLVVCSGAALFSWTANVAADSSSRLVVRGKEIVVSYGATRRSLPFGREVMSRLRLPKELRLRTVAADRTVGVVTSAQPSSIENGSPVLVDSEEIVGVCTKIQRLNKEIPLLCEANSVRSIGVAPNDPKIAHQYAHTRISSEAAWNISTGSHGVTIAIVDTGVNYNHPDLQGNIRVNGGETAGNGIDDDVNGYVDDLFGYDFAALDGDPVDEHGHGTHCAGIVGATGNNATGISGINWSVGILPVRVLDASGSGTNADVAAGIRYATTRGASVISLSLGGNDESVTIDDAIAAARSADILVAVAAGNDSDNNDVRPTYPANSMWDNVIAVAATSSSDHLASFSNYGPRTVDIAAPGESILSTWLGSSYEYLDGTSMATPLVAGLAGLMKAVNPSLTYYDLKGILMGTVDQLSSLRGRVLSNGRINALSAVSLASSVGPYPTPNPGISTGQSAGVYALSLRLRKSGNRRLLTGKARDSSKNPIGDLKIRLRCSGFRTQAAQSDDDGFYGFKVARPRSTMTCYVADLFGNRSKKLRVR